MKMRNPPRTLKGFELWLRRQGRQRSRAIEADLKLLPDDLHSRMSRLREWWYHLEKGKLLPKIGEITRQPETPGSRQKREETDRQAAIRHFQTTDRRRITQYKTPDSEWRPHRGPKRPLPWPWPR